jgi:hypothetical protein
MCGVLNARVEEGIESRQRTHYPVVPLPEERLSSKPTRMRHSQNRLMA